MRTTDDLAPATRAALDGHDVVLFDGQCVLCSGFFRLIVRADRGHRFRFVTAQSPLGQAIYRDLDLPTEDFETNLVIVDGVLHDRLDAFAAAMSALGWPWRVFGIVRFLPRRLKDPVYLAIARNRYAIFGRYDHCMIPTPDLRDRFLDRPA